MPKLTEVEAECLRNAQGRLADLRDPVMRRLEKRDLIRPVCSYDRENYRIPNSFAYDFSSPKFIFVRTEKGEQLNQPKYHVEAAE